MSTSKIFNFLRDFYSLEAGELLPATVVSFFVVVSILLVLFYFIFDNPNIKTCTPLFLGEVGFTLTHSQVNHGLISI